MLTIWLDLYSLWFKKNLHVIIEKINNQLHVWTFLICRSKCHFYMQTVKDEDFVTDLKEAYIRKYSREEVNKIWNIWSVSFSKQLHKCSLHDLSVKVSHYSVTMTIILGTVYHLELFRHSVLDTGCVTIISCKCRNGPSPVGSLRNN